MYPIFEAWLGLADLGANALTMRTTREPIIFLRRC